MVLRPRHFVFIQRRGLEALIGVAGKASSGLDRLRAEGGKPARIEFGKAGLIDISARRSSWLSCWPRRPVSRHPRRSPRRDRRAVVNVISSFLAVK